MRQNRQSSQELQESARSFQQQGTQKRLMERKRRRAKSLKVSDSAKNELSQQKKAILEKLEEGGWENVSLTPLILTTRSLTGMGFFIFCHSPTEPFPAELTPTMCLAL